MPTGTKVRKMPPNIVLIMTDDQGYGDLACHANPVIKTPNIDRLYSQSTRLTNFHVSPTCSPTRASLMTGRYCNRTGVWHTIMGRSLLRREEVTMADIFRAAGYSTAIFGKWHLGDNYPFRPQDRGFDEVLVHGGGGIGQTPDYWGNDYFDDTYCHNGSWRKYRGYCTDVWFEQSLRFIEENADRPFFCYLATNAPHKPYRVPQEYARAYKNKGVNAAFYGMITNIDENIGRLMNKLDELGLSDNTILIFMTDNGSSDARFNAGMRGNKGDPYDGGHRVPFFIRWPGGPINAGVDIDKITAHIDVLPTLIELCGLQKPPKINFDGKSLAPLLTNPGKNWPDRTLIIDSQRIEHPKKWRKCAVMTNRWRLINGKELYDIIQDPGQKNNIAGQYPDVVARLCKEYEKWWDDVSERFDEYCRIVVGSDNENPSKLTSHDWHGDVPWNQEQVRLGLKANGFWAIEIARDGDYEISLRRWPRELRLPITSAPPGGTSIKPKVAGLKVAQFDRKKAIEANDEQVTFKVRLKAGTTELKTWFIDQDGTSRGAYYVYVNHLT